MAWAVQKFCTSWNVAFFFCSSANIAHMLPCMHLRCLSSTSKPSVTNQSHLVGFVAFHVNIIVLIFYFEGRDQWNIYFCGRYKTS